MNANQSVKAIEPALPLRTRGRPRKRDTEATRAAILSAARSRFAADNYDRVGLREIAADVGVDPALIIRYFGSKDGLFEAVLSDELYPDLIFRKDRATYGDYMMSALAGAEGAYEFDYYMLLLRAATIPAMLPRLERVIEERLMRPLIDWLGGEQAPLRAKLITTFLTGVAIHRLTAGPAPLSPAEEDQFRQIGATMIQALIDGPRLDLPGSFTPGTVKAEKD